MSETILKFTLPEDQDELTLAQRGTDLYCALHDMDNWLRGEIKYHGKDLQDVRDQLWEFLSDHNINLDTLVS